MMTSIPATASRRKLAQAAGAAALASRRRIDHHSLARQMLRESLALTALARKSAHRRRLGHGPFRRQFVLGGVRLQLLKSNFSANCSIRRDERSER